MNYDTLPNLSEWFPVAEVKRKREDVLNIILFLSRTVKTQTSDSA